MSASVGARYFAKETGGLLTVDKGATLPPVCVKCGGRERLHLRSETFQSMDAWIYAFFLLSGALALALLLWVTPRRGTLEVPLCDACERRWRMGAGLWKAGLAWLILLSLLAYFILFLTWSLGAFLVLELVAIAPALILRWTVVPTDALVALEIGAEQLVLGGVHPEARAAIVAAANG